LSQGTLETRSPSWTKKASIAQAFLHGIAGTPSVPVLVVTITFIGFGALARDLGLDVFQTMFVAGGVFALPGQVVLVSEASKGAGLAAVAFAVTLTSVRLLPMSFSLFPVMRNKNTPRWLEFLLSHFVAITIWIEAMRRLPTLPRKLRVAYFSGFASAMMVTLLAATVTGFFLAAKAPPVVAAGMVFLTPIYFFLSLIETARNVADKWAVGIGVILGPALYHLLPGLDLFLTGLIGGTMSYGMMKWLNGRGQK
jgi:predicted branched-subunit amino acid permease